MNRHARNVLMALVAALAAPAALRAQGPIGASDNVILITLDGARVEEMFGGLNLEILRSTLKQGQVAEDQPVYRRFWADSPQARRQKLMPFFWTTLMTGHGSIAGNGRLGSTVRLTNRHPITAAGAPRPTGATTARRSPARRTSGSRSSRRR